MAVFAAVAAELTLAILRMSRHMVGSRMMVIMPTVAVIIVMMMLVVMSTATVFIVVMMVIVPAVAVVIVVVVFVVVPTTAVVIMVVVFVVVSTAAVVIMLVVMFVIMPTAAVIIMVMMVIMPAATVFIVMVMFVVFGSMLMFAATSLDDADIGFQAVGDALNFGDQRVGILGSNSELLGREGEGCVLNFWEREDFLLDFCSTVGTAEVFKQINFFCHGKPPKKWR